MKKIVPGRCVGRIAIPPSKSDAQRALLAASLFSTETQLWHVGNSADEQAMSRCCEALGAVLKDIGNGSRTVTATAIVPDNLVLDCGESGLCTRLLAGLLALSGKRFTLTGQGSLRQRKFPEIVRFISNWIAPGFESPRGHVPLTVEALSVSGDISADGSEGSQFISGLLMGMCLNRNVGELHVKNLKSIPYVRMTLATLREFGFVFEEEGMERFRLVGSRAPAKQYTIAADWSSASCWLVAAALQDEPGKLVISGLDNGSPQADKRLLEALLAAGCRIQVSDEGITVDGTARRPFAFNATHCPDLFPALAVLAACTEGVSEISGVHRLRNKESDRAAAIRVEWEKAGIFVGLKDDLMQIHGKSHVNGAGFDAHSDHRMAMACAILATRADSPSTLEGSESVSKSYPSFWDDLERTQLP